MDSTTIVWIVAAIVAILVIAGLVFAARSRRNQHRHIEAERIREDVTTHVAKVDKREALADETAAKARAAEAEAEAKAAEAARLKNQAESHREVRGGASREDIEERRRHADELDPKVRVARRRGRPRRPTTPTLPSQQAAQEDAARQEAERK